MRMTMMDVSKAAARILQLDEVAEMLDNYVIPTDGDGSDPDDDYATGRDEVAGGDTTDADNVDGGDEESVPDTRAVTDPDAQLLANAVRTAVFEISNDGFPSTVTVLERTVDGTIPTTVDDDGKARFVIAVTKNGEPVKFAYTPCGVSVGHGGEFCVTYCTREDGTLDYGDEIMLDARIGVYAVAYRAARNYCLMTGRNDEASVWDQRYIEETEKLRIRRRAYLPKRRWI